MKGDWVYVDFARAFVPNWLSKLMSLKVMSAVLLALLVFVVAVGR